MLLYINEENLRIYSYIPLKLASRAYGSMHNYGAHSISK